MKRLARRLLMLFLLVSAIGFMAATCDTADGGDWDFPMPSPTPMFPQ